MRQGAQYFGGLMTKTATSSKKANATGKPRATAAIMYEENGKRVADPVLRKRAEKRLAHRPNHDTLSGIDALKLVHELQVHQIELEMQNEELQRANAAIETARARFSDLFDFSPVGYAALDNKGIVLEANLTLARMMGFDRNFLIQKPFQSFVAPEDKNTFLLFSQRLVASDVKTTFDIRFTRKDASVFYAQIVSTICEDSLKANRKFLLSILDFTDRRNAEQALAAEVVRREELSQALERSNEDLEQFAYVASHDLQEPLRAVSGFAELLKRHLGDSLDEEGSAYVGRIVDGASRMGGLISGLLQYSRIGSQVKAFRSTIAKDALDKALSNLGEAIKDSGAQVIVSELPSIVMDPLQLELLFQNLIGNAIKFRVKESPSKITICATKRKADWLFAVSDNGIGLDPKFADRIFAIFQRLHSQSTYAGTGIGLALCKKIVERNGGKIWVESKPGEGATFFFTVPDSVQTPNE